MSRKVDEAAILKVKRRMCLTIADEIETALRLDPFKSSWDKDKAYEIIYEMIPNTYAEAEAEMEWSRKFVDEAPGPKKPSIGQRLREAMGLPDGFDLIQTLEAAIERIKGTTCECGRKKTPGVCPACDNEE